MNARWAWAAAVTVLVSGCGAEVLPGAVLWPDAGQDPADAGKPASDAGSSPADAGIPADAGVPPEDAGVAPPDAGSLDAVVDVPPSGPYGTRTFTVPAGTNWVNSGLYLRAGQAATISAQGTWSVEGTSAGPEGVLLRGKQRGCTRGSLVARSGLRFEGDITCIGMGSTFTAPKDGAVYVGMVDSTDLGEAYGDRLKASGSLQVTVTSTGDTVPAIGLQQLPSYPLGTVASGQVELLGRHVIVSVSAAQALADLSTAVASLQTLDALYEAEAQLRGMAPFGGQRVRFWPDDTVASVGYMLAGNPIRCVPELMGGGQDQRILRASEPLTDVWGFSHELGHTFSFANGTWVYEYGFIESWPNVFTLRALETTGRLANQPNVASYCNGKAGYLASGTYVDAFKADPFLELCFLMEFQKAHGWAFYETFFRGMNTQLNGDVAYDGTDASVWGYVRNRFNLAAGTDVTPVFTLWKVPVN